jgi:hypothetical protein
MHNRMPAYDEISQGTNGLSHLWVHKSLKIEKTPEYISHSCLTERVIKTNPSFTLDDGGTLACNLEEALDLVLLCPFNPIFTGGKSQHQRRLAPY